MVTGKAKWQCFGGKITWKRSCNSKNFLDCCHTLTAAIGFLCIQVETMSKEKRKKNNIANKIGAKRPRDHDDPAAIQVVEAQIH